MIKFHEYIPGFCSGIAARSYEVETLEELLQQPVFLSWAKLPEFSSFCKSDNYVMALFSFGKKWYVVGLFEGELDLPVWRRDATSS